MTNNNSASFIWSIADLLRGNYSPARYADVILPMTVLRRIDCVLDENREQVSKDIAAGVPDVVLVNKYGFYNKTDHSMETLLDDPANIKDNMIDYIQGFSDDVCDIFENFGIIAEIEKMNKKKILFDVCRKFTREVDLHPDVISNMDMGLMFEELIRKFTEAAAAEDGEFFTPRDAIKLLVAILFAEDTEALEEKGIIRSIYDPTVGTGGMLSVAEETLKEINPDAVLTFYGQEKNDDSYAICKSDMLIKGQNPDQIRLGNTLEDDLFANETFDYCLSNPPYGVDWKISRSVVEREHKDLGMRGRFGMGLPPVTDGQLLFMSHLLSKMKPAESGGSRVGIVMNGSSLFSGAAGSGASNIRRYLFEQDLVEAIIALPTDMFYNTDITTYIWILDNTKRKERLGKVQLIDASAIFTKMRKSLGEKSVELSEDNILQISQIYSSFEESNYSKIFPNEAFGYLEIPTYQPRRLRFELDDNHIKLVMSSAAVLKLDDSKKQQLEETLRALPDSFQKTTSHADLVAAIKEASSDSKAPSMAIIKAIINYLGEDDPEAEIFIDKDGLPLPGEKDSERIALTEDLDKYIEREVRPHAPDTVVLSDKAKIGYEIPFTRLFYKYEPPRSTKEIDQDIGTTVDKITSMLALLERGGE